MNAFTDSYSTLGLGLLRNVDIKKLVDSIQCKAFL